MMTPKRKILEAAMQKQQALIDDFRQRIRDAMANDGNVNEEEYDSQSQTFKAVISSEVDALTEELGFAQAELEDLRKIDPDARSEDVVLGAVVRTDQRDFFVSSSLEEFKAGTKSFFGISVHSPIFKLMNGKRTGDRFRIQNTVYLIENIY
jgi:hypothetical protein